MPFARKLMGHDSPFLSREVTWRRLGEIETLNDELEAAREAGDRDAARAMRRQSGPLIGMAASARALRRDLSDIRMRRQATRERDDWPVSRRREAMDALDARERRLMAGFNRRYLARLEKMGG